MHRNDYNIMRRGPTLTALTVTGHDSTGRELKPGDKIIVRVDRVTTERGRDEKQGA